MRRTIGKNKLVGMIVVAIMMAAICIFAGKHTSFADNTAVLNVSMNIEDDRYDIPDETECNIFIYLNDAEGTPIEGDFSYTGDESGTITFTEGKAELILHGASSSVKFENLPENAKYKIELKKYGCWYNEKTSSGKEGTLGVEEKIASITCTVNTMDQKVIAIVDMVDKVPVVAGNSFEYATYCPMPKEGVLYYTGTNDVRQFDIRVHNTGGFTLLSKVVLEDNGVAVLHNIPYNRNPNKFYRRDSDLTVEGYGIYGNEGFVVFGENDYTDDNPRKLHWAGTSGVSGEYVVMRAGERTGYASVLAKLYARQNEDGEIVKVDSDFEGGEEEKEHTFRVRIYYHSALGEDHNFYLTNYLLPISIKTVGSDEEPEEGMIKLDENGEAYIKLKANQVCTFGKLGQSLSALPISYNELSNISFDDEGNLILDERFHSVNNLMLSIPHSDNRYYGDLQVEEVDEDNTYTSVKYFGDDLVEFFNDTENSVRNYITANPNDYGILMWLSPFSTCIINTRNFTGELEVKKEFEGENDPDREFTFRIKFEDDASDLKDFYMNNIYLDYGDRKVHLELDENYEGTFKLKAGDKVNIVSDCENLQKGLPVGARYTITEDPGEDYKTEATNAVGKVKDGVITVTFNNSTATVEDPIGKPEEEKEEVKEEKKAAMPRTGDIISISCAVLILSICVLCNVASRKKNKKI